MARASLEELLADFKDFLRQRGLSCWLKDDPRITEIRKLAYLENRSYADYKSYIEQKDPETAANTALCLVYQATFLLDRLLNPNISRVSCNIRPKRRDVVASNDKRD